MKSFITYGSYPPFLPSEEFSEAQGEGFDKEIPFITVCAKISYCLYIVQL